MTDTALFTRRFVIGFALVEALLIGWALSSYFSR
jgi:hypothetical protein